MPLSFAVIRETIASMSAHPKPFTDLDVLARASRGQGWSPHELRKAQSHTIETLIHYFRTGKLVRFGPVIYDDHLDYARKASRVLYAGVTTTDKGLVSRAPALDTPNGEFEPIFSWQAPPVLRRSGRRSGTNRDDTKEWPSSPLHEELAQADEELAQAKRRVRELRQRIAEESRSS